MGPPPLGGGPSVVQGEWCGACGWCASTDGSGHVWVRALPQNTGCRENPGTPGVLPLTTATPPHWPGQGPRRPPTGAARFTLALTGTGRRSTLPLGQTPLPSGRLGSGSRPGALLYLFLGVGGAPLFFHNGYVGLYPGAHLQILAECAEFLIDGFDG